MKCHSRQRRGRDSFLLAALVLPKHMPPKTLTGVGAHRAAAATTVTSIAFANVSLNDKADGQRRATGGGLCFSRSLGDI